MSKSQLTAFASGARRTDLDAQMRNIARNMTPDEINEAAKYYSSLGEATARLNAYVRQNASPI